MTNQLHYQVYMVQDNVASKNGNYDAGWLATCNCGRDFWMGGKGTKVEIQNQINHHLAQVNTVQSEEEKELAAKVRVQEQQIESFKARLADKQDELNAVSDAYDMYRERSDSQLRAVVGKNTALHEEILELKETNEDLEQLVEDTVIVPGYRSRAGRTSYVVYTRHRNSIDPEDYATTYWPDEHTARIDYAAHKDNDFYKELLKQSTVTYTYSVLLENNEHEE